MRILLAIDGSEFSDAAVREVAARPWPRGSIVKVLSVVDLSFVGAPALAPVSPDIFGDLEAALVAQAEGAVARAKAALAKNTTPGLVVETRVAVGPPALTIREIAEGWDANLVVVGSHGRGTVKRLLLGSVSSSVAFHAPCSVEIVQAHAPSAGAGREVSS
jgi:nucleotide-binding universal stress UspA family protein